MFLKSKKNIIVCLFVIIVFLLVFILSHYILKTIMLNRPMVSFVMPTYNRADLLPHAIDSILNQTFEDFELIIVDDGSTDNTAHVLKQYQKKDARIRVIFSKPNKGVAVARQIGNETARGKYIAIMDSDDVLFSKFLERAIDYLEKNENVTILKLKPYEEKAYLNPYKKAAKNYYDLYQILFFSAIGNVGCIYRRDFVEKHNISYNQNYRCGEDYDFWMQMLAKGANVRFLNTKEALYYIEHSQKAKEYYNSCHKNAREISRNFFNSIGMPANFLESPCLTFKHVIAYNPDIFDEETQNKGTRHYCAPSGDFIMLKTREWRDYVVFSKDKRYVERYKLAGEKGTIVSFIPKKEITIKWDNDNRGTETFFYIDRNVYSKNMFIELKHPDWWDIPIFSKDKKRVKRRNRNNDEGTVISFIPKQKITIKWDNWGEETFIYTAGNVYVHFSTVRVKYPNRTEILIFSKDMNWIKRKHEQEFTGSVISYSVGKEIVINWNRKGMEVLRLTDKTNE